MTIFGARVVVVEMVLTEPFQPLSAPSKPVIMVDGASNLEPVPLAVTVVARVFGPPVAVRMVKLPLKLPLFSKLKLLVPAILKL